MTVVLTRQTGHSKTKVSFLHLYMTL